MVDCAFMDRYNPATVFSSIDRQGRYAYANQPPIEGWNITRFAETLLPLIHDDPEDAVALAQQVIEQYPQFYYTNWLAGMRAKLGLFNEEQQDAALIDELLTLMEKHEADYTNTFRSLTFQRCEGTALFDSMEFKKWYEQWQARRQRQEPSKAQSQQLMRDTNPAVIPRNHRVEEALEAAVTRGDYRVMDKLLQVLSQPYAHLAEQEAYATLPAPSNCPYQTFCGT
ncbi:Protein adenylyltransferase SelO OS=Lysinibacillus sphaericus OX=1421 GN=selO PE=3 SV=1 [Lysinibacillus sphaericus]